jgi:hypothetical protein
MGNNHNEQTGIMSGYLSLVVSVFYVLFINIVDLPRAAY